MSEHTHTEQPATVAGLHLSGPNSHKSAIVVLEGHPLRKPLNLIGLYEKIGSQGKLFSDERLVEILHSQSRIDRVFVDCPLSAPPCVECLRPRCPGVLACEDVSVAYMLALAEARQARGRRRRRSANPQSHRLWDVFQATHAGSGEEPSYSANMAPLVTRAKTLQRRLNSIEPLIRLRETSVKAAMVRLCAALGLPPAHAQQFRNFEKGRERREAFVKHLVQQGWLARGDERFYTSLEVFQAFVTGFVASLHEAGLVQQRPHDFLPQGGWLYLPTLQQSFLDRTSVWSDGDVAVGVNSYS